MMKTILLALSLGFALPLAAQNSAYSVLGIGFPAAPFGVVARSMGGGSSATDPQSFINPGALGLVNALFVQAASMQEFRRYSIGGVTATGLRQNRFPYVGVSGPIGPRFAYFTGFGQYAERTYDVATVDTLIIRGAPVGVSDRLSSAGGVSDIRAALAWSRSPRFSMGLAAHILTGSAKVTTERVFADPVYRPFKETVDAGYSGYGISAGVVATLAALRVGGSIRVDGKLDRQVDKQKIGQVDLPVSLSLGGEYRPSPVLRIATSGTWRSWSSAGPDLATGTRAFNTIDVGAGVELGGAPGGPPFPVRLGVRFATLPFSPTTDQPREIDLSAGTGLVLSGGRARLEFGLERAMRDGGGAEERSWQISVGFHVRP